MRVRVQVWVGCGWGVGVSGGEPVHAHFGKTACSHSLRACCKVCRQVIGQSRSETILAAWQNYLLDVLCLVCGGNRSRCGHLSHTASTPYSMCTVNH